MAGKTKAIEVPQRLRELAEKNVDQAREPVAQARWVVSRASARSNSEPLANSIPRASSCWIKSFNR